MGAGLSPNGILHDLAERDPVSHGQGERRSHCRLCFAKVEAGAGPVRHEPTCVWLRARTLLEGHGTASADLEQLAELSRARDTRNREPAGQRGRRAVVSDPPILESRTAWFHDADPSAALHAAASWLREHGDEGNLQAVIVNHSTLDAEGHSCGNDEDGAIWQTSIGVVQER